jgi:hypothetical protein
VFAFSEARCAFFDRNLHFEDAIGSHACSLEASVRVINGIPLGCSLFLLGRTVNCVQTLKVSELPINKEHEWLACASDDSRRARRGIPVNAEEQLGGRPRRTLLQAAGYDSCLKGKAGSCIDVNSDQCTGANVLTG